MNFWKFIFLPLFLIFSAFTVLAATPSSIGVNVAPENPAPGENTTITLNSYVNNLDTVLISWFVNGTNSSSGIGKKSFSVNAPAAGSQTTVVARIALPEGTLETRVIIQPSSLVLLYQATDSYVPPFYKGKALPVADSEIKVVALPSGNPRNMTYAWKKDYSNDQNASGYGKNAFIFTNDYLEGVNNISVVASTIEGASSSASLNVGTVLPKIVFYKQDAALGTIWERVLESGHKIVGEETIVAIPYFISPKEIRNPSLVWNWLINNSRVNTQISRENFLPLKVEGGISGTSRISLEIENRDKIFQTAKKEINVEF